jgi:succinyl-CoA synthetase beta subunit
MHLHEYQAKEILREYGIPVGEFDVFSSLSELEIILQQRGWTEAVIKVQIYAGGRGKAGGVQIAKSLDEIRQTARNLLGKKIINEQTGPKGLTAKYLLISPLVSIQHEYYLSLTIQRETARCMLLASPAGGINIEQIALDSPERLLLLPLPAEGTFRPYQLVHLAKFMGWKGDLILQGNALVHGLTKAFVEKDATLLEVNPLVETKEGKLTVLDAKMMIDENALYRHPKYKEYADPSQMLPSEVQAQKNELAYIALDGNIGCIVNGAGLAMATMDLIQEMGGKPANFLDVGGGATKEKIVEGFKIILMDRQVKVILINIFGGIMNCKTLAEGILAAIEEIQLALPVVVRMEGTQVEEGKKCLQNVPIKLFIANHLLEAAQEAVKFAKQIGA